jgi:hypothetical protein
MKLFLFAFSIFFNISSFCSLNTWEHFCQMPKTQLLEKHLEEEKEDEEEQEERKKERERERGVFSCWWRNYGGLGIRVTFYSCPAIPSRPSILASLFL